HSLDSGGQDLVGFAESLGKAFRFNKYIALPLVFGLHASTPSNKKAFFKLRGDTSSSILYMYRKHFYVKTLHSDVIINHSIVSCVIINHSIVSCGRAWIL
ncbi:hypothetical protein MTR67_010749, partial [Solanum verrucosum]